MWPYICAVKYALQCPLKERGWGSGGGGRHQASSFSKAITFFSKFNILEPKLCVAGAVLDPFLEVAFAVPHASDPPPGFYVFCSVVFILEDESARWKGWLR